MTAHTDRRDATDAQFADELARLNRLDVADESAVETVARALLGHIARHNESTDEGRARARSAARAAIHALKPAPGTDTSGQAVQRVLDVCDRADAKLRQAVPMSAAEHIIERGDHTVKVSAIRAAVAGPQRGHGEEGATWGFCPHCGDWCVLDVHGVAACGENR